MPRPFSFARFDMKNTEDLIRYLQKYTPTALQINGRLIPFYKN